MPRSAELDQLIAQLRAMREQSTQAPGGWGDAAIATGLRVAPGVLGGLVGLAGGPVGAAAGGMAGSALGDYLAQQYEQSQGLREDFSPGQLGIEALLGAIPGGKAGSTALRTALMRGALPGAALGAGETLAMDMAEGQPVDPQRAIMAALLGAGLGAGAHKVGARMLPGRAPAAGVADDVMPAARQPLALPPASPVDDIMRGRGPGGPAGPFEVPPRELLQLGAPPTGRPPGPPVGPFEMGAGPQMIRRPTPLSEGPPQIPMPAVLEGELLPQAPRALPAAAGGPYTGPGRVAAGGQAPTLEEFPTLPDATRATLERLRGRPAPTADPALAELFAGAGPAPTRTPRDFAAATRRRSRRLPKKEAGEIVEKTRQRVRRLTPEEAADSADAVRSMPVRDDPSARKVHQQVVRMLDDRAAQPHRVQTPDADTITLGASGNFGDMAKLGEDLRSEKVIRQLHAADPESAMMLISKLVRRREDIAAGMSPSVQVTRADFERVGLTGEAPQRLLQLLERNKSLLGTLDSYFEA